MSEYRQLHRSFWESGSVEQMDPVEKLLYCYLITAPVSNMEGLYKTTLRRMAFETGIDRDMVMQLCQRLEEKRLGGFKDGYVCVTQAVSHMSGSPKMLKHAETLYASVPTDVMQWALSIGYVKPDKIVGYHIDTIAYTRLDKTRLDKEDAKPSTRYDNLVKKYGKKVVDEYVESVENYCAAKGKRYKDKVAAAANWMKRDGVATLPGYGVKATPKLPTCGCGGKLKEYEPGRAMCENRDSEWRLLNDLWTEVSE